jgi:hypothetical protein
MTKDEALNMAIEALEHAELVFYITKDDGSKVSIYAETINACKEALNIANCDLKQPAQEPEFDLKDLACSAHEEAMSFGLDRNLFERYFKKIANLYTNPHQWQGLTDDEINEMAKEFELCEMGLLIYRGMVRTIEAKLKDKNT